MYAPLLIGFTHFNNDLFSGELPDCLLTIRAKGRTQGFYSPKRFAAVKDPTVLIDEIAMNPACFSVEPRREIAATIVHEMNHHWQEHCGTPPRNGYHDREWATKMRSIGLVPSDTGTVGGRQTGYRMSHYIIENGAFARSFERLAATGWQIGWGDAAALAIDPAFVEGGVIVGDGPKPKKREAFKCGSRSITAEARASAQLVCLPCALAARPDLADFLQQFKFKLVERRTGRVFACSDVSARPTSLPLYVEKRLETAPEHSDRRGIAAIHTELFGPISPRSLEEWPLVWKLVAGKAVANTREAITYAYQRFRDAPEYRGGRTKKELA
jgi:hypothetical protein